MDTIKLRKISAAVYLACPKEVADDISKNIIHAANEIDRLRNELKILIRGISDNIGNCNIKEPDSDPEPRTIPSMDFTGMPCRDIECDGIYTETSIHDDMDGVLHCIECGNELKRWQELDQLPEESDGQTIGDVRSED